MNRYRNKEDNSVVEAVEYTSWDVGKEINMHTDGFGSHYEQRDDERVFPKTGDWIIIGLNNRAFKVLKADIFKLVYEKIRF